MLSSSLSSRQCSNPDSFLNLARHWSDQTQITINVTRKAHAMKIFSTQRIKSQKVISSTRWRPAMTEQEIVGCQTAPNFIFSSKTATTVSTTQKVKRLSSLAAKLRLSQSTAVARWPVAATFNTNFSSNRTSTKMMAAISCVWEMWQMHNLPKYKQMLKNMTSTNSITERIKHPHPAFILTVKKLKAWIKRRKFND